MQSFRGWPMLADGALAERFANLEKGTFFGAAGLPNFVESDFFGWYVRHLTPELLDCLRAVLARITENDSSMPLAAAAGSGDVLKEFYLCLVSPAIRKSLGEYYTPDWL